MLLFWWSYLGYLWSFFPLRLWKEKGRARWVCYGVSSGGSILSVGLTDSRSCFTWLRGTECSLACFVFGFFIYFSLYVTLKRVISLTTQSSLFVIPQRHYCSPPLPTPPLPTPPHPQAVCPESQLPSYPPQLTIKLSSYQISSPGLVSYSYLRT